MGYRVLELDSANDEAWQQNLADVQDWENLTDNDSRSQTIANR